MHKARVASSDSNRVSSHARAGNDKQNKLSSLLPALFASPMGKIGDQSAWRPDRVKVKWKLGEEFLAKPHP